MNILQINYADIRGGAERIAFNLLSELKENGHNVSMNVGYKFTNRDDVIEIDNNTYRNFWAKFWRRIEYISNYQKIRVIPRFARWVATPAEPQRWLDQLCGIEDFHFPATKDIPRSVPHSTDLIHAHNLHGNYFDLRELSKLSEYVPVLITLHDMWLFTGHCAHSFNCIRWKFGCGECPDLSIYPSIQRDSTAANWQRKKEIYSQSNLYLAVPSQWLLEQVNQSMLRPLVLDIRLISNGIDLSIFHPGSLLKARQELGLPEEVKIVVFASNRTHNNPFKDYQTLEDAIRIVGNQYSDHDILFLCLGENGHEKDLGRSKVIFKEYLKNPRELVKYYQAADLYIHAAHAEVFGLTITEAMACGVPVVATEIGGIPEQIDSYENGYLIPHKDSTTMAERIIHLLSDPALRKSMGDKAEKKARKNFSLQSMVSNYIAYYETILKDFHKKQESPDVIS